MTSAHAPAASQRLHSLDALRAAMMLVVILLHSTHSFGLFMFSVDGFEWRFWGGIRDSSATVFSAILLEQLFNFFNAFCMPAFFLVAGLFANPLSQRGAVAMIRDRAVRILIPFLAGVILLLPLITAVRVCGRARAQSVEAGIPWPDIGQCLVSGEFLAGLGPHYLWFLLYLLIFYVGVLVFRPVLGSMGWLEPLSEAAGKAVRKLCHSRWAPCYLAIPTFVVLILTRSPLLAENGERFIPEPGLVLHYGLFFAFGWALYRRQDLLPGLAGNWRVYGLMGGILFTMLSVFSVGATLNQLKGNGATLAPGAFATKSTVAGLPAGAKSAVLQNLGPNSEGPAAGSGPLPPPPVFFGMRLVTALLSWSLTLAAVGIFYRYLDRPNRLIRYLADSSYWAYLAHVPLLMALQVLIAPWPLPWWVKLPLLNLALGLILLVCYDFLVRPTCIGTILNGRRRYPGISSLLDRSHARQSEGC